MKQLKANTWGIHDAHGNVFEWCSDWYGEYGAEDQSDPRGPDDGPDRAIRGGSWCGRARGCRSAVRDWWPPSGRDLLLGFRFAAGP